MTKEERQLLISELTEIEERLKGGIPNPKDMRRVDEITSLLLSDGENNEMRFKAGKKAN